MVKKLGLIWMSAGNSYFTEKVIEKVVRKALPNFSKLIIMAPDEPAEHTFKALGYELKIAKRKARLNANLLQNRAKRVVEKLGEDAREKVKVVDWVEEIIPNQAYQRKYKEMVNLYKNNAKFKTDALKITLSIIRSKKKIADIKKASAEAVYYLLKELAFVLASPEIYSTEKVSYIYHKRWDVYENLINGFYDGEKKDSLNFFLLKV